jgi:unsaturated rhamnogalacturonyl hydrolase
MGAENSVAVEHFDFRLQVMTMTSIVRSTLYALILPALVGHCFAAAPDTQPTFPVADVQTSNSVPYAPPSVVGITRILDRVRRRLESRMIMRVTLPATSQPISDPPGAEQTTIAGQRPFTSLDYPSGVAYAGMLSAGEATNDKAYTDFVASRFQFFADNLPKFKESGGVRFRNPFRNLLLPTSLDSCGALGASLIKAQRAGVGGDLKAVIDRYAEYVSHGQFRLDDGTLARGRPFANSLWADDMYMSVPLLSQMGAMTGQTIYFDDAARQVIQISARLFVPASGLYTHAWNAQAGDDQPHYYWGRANGWCIMAMVELLDVLPENHPQREEILKLLRAHAKGLASVQSGQGLWHQMLDRNDSYLETSCTAMFTYGLARAVNKGWLNAGTFGPVAIAGWNGLTTRIDADGRVTGTCVGTSYASDYVYYYNRPAGDDVHGYGPVLFAGAEMIRLMNNPRFRIQGSSTQPMAVIERRATSAP